MMKILETLLFISLILPMAYALDGRSKGPTMDASSTDIMGGGTPGYMEGGVKKPLKRVPKQKSMKQQQESKHGVRTDTQDRNDRGSINTGDDLPQKGKRNSPD